MTRRCTALSRKQVTDLADRIVELQGDTRFLPREVRSSQSEKNVRLLFFFHGIAKRHQDRSGAPLPSVPFSSALVFFEECLTSRQPLRRGRSGVAGILQVIDQTKNFRIPMTCGLCQNSISGQAIQEVSLWVSEGWKRKEGCIPVDVVKD